MFRNRIYYRIKPLIPWSVRMAIRRRFARRKRKQMSGVWPILPGSEKPPANWPGWPDGKQFALVLTHDIEGQEGLNKVRALAELEMSMGFRSCFNFIPEGGYRVPKELRDWLTGNGFEIGVHDLHHDGKLFHSRSAFRERAARINHYLNVWDTVGFRAGFMLNKLDWLHDLNIQYDASTFDTDPFEPQPEGRGTIFPFWVPGPASATDPARRTGYVELPYTLPQDSTLFLLLRETTPAVWLQKLDWVARNGGMALLDVHPDYLDFGGKSPSHRRYRAGIYEQFLAHVRHRYAGAFWHGLPREVAEFTARLKSAYAPRKPRRICMVTHSYYNTDGRVTRYAEALAEQGDQVDVFSLRRSPGVGLQETIAGVNVHRIQDRFGKREKSQLAFLLPLLRFFLVSSLAIARHHTRKRYHLVHVHNIPDFLVFAAWYPKLTGASVILDIHDIVPEFYASKFEVARSRVLLPMLKLMERLSARFADHVIIANDLWVEKYARRTGANGKCSVFINNVDARIFAPRPRTRRDDRTIVMFPGGLQWHQGLDIAIRAFRCIVDRVPGAEFHIYGDGNMKETLVELSRELGLNGNVRFFDPLPVRDIADVMANADLGVVPKRADSFGNEAYSTKIMEFMSLGVPVVVSSTKIDRFYFDDTVVRFFESGKPEALAEAALEVLGNQTLQREIVGRASAYAARHSWENRKSDYLKLVDHLCAQR